MVEFTGRTEVDKFLELETANRDEEFMLPTIKKKNDPM